MYWPVSCASLVYKLYIAFQTQSDTNIHFIGLYLVLAYLKMSTLTLLAYQELVGFGSVNCTTYLWHVPKSEAIFMFERFCIMKTVIPTDWYFLQLFFWSVSCSSLVCELWILFWTFRDNWQCFDITRYFALSYIEKLISSGSYFFSYFLLVSKLN